MAGEGREGRCDVPVQLLVTLTIALPKLRLGLGQHQKSHLQPLPVDDSFEHFV